MLFDVAREASAREEIGTKGVDRKELPYDLYDVLFAAKIVAKPFGDIAPGDFGDRRGAAFQNGEARFTEMDAQKTRNLAKLPLGLAGECLAGAIAFADAFLERRYHQACAEADRGYSIVGRALLQRSCEPLSKIARVGHIAISGTPASVRS